MEPTSSVRRPESGTLAECGEGDSSNGRPYRDPYDTLWTWQQHEETRYRGPMADYGAWQQQWEARNLP
ncbi:unnamed protein product [Staurois parvus]|uniref:MHC class I antigen n=1 Tax=Staurois parvus TaxID=386267 RepID=A0ABN9FBH3_9NEOB|nr:unnamed protein product [Staurois parvus]